jgi:cytochrome oxidase Cu insertion factor (SCO1/SenC/PrrC family)
VVKPPPPDLWRISLNDVQIREIVTHGGEGVGRSPIMPGWGVQLSSEEINAVVAYVSGVRGGESVGSSVQHVRNDRRRAVLAGLCTPAALGAVGVHRAVRAHAGPHASAATSAAGGAAPRAGLLLDHTGRRFELQRLAGRPSLLTFGFTQCSSTCPMSLQTATELLGRGAPDRLQGVFVSLDPLAETLRVGVRRGVPEGLAHSSMWYLLDERVVVRSVAKYDAPVAELETLLARTRVSTR